MKNATLNSNASDINQLATDVAVILSKVQYIESDVKSVKDKLENDYVTQDQFEPIKKVVYGLVSIILVSVIVALVALVIIK